jgi:hypothetical protein
VAGHKNFYLKKRNNCARPQADPKANRLPLNKSLCKGNAGVFGRQADDSASPVHLSQQEKFFANDNRNVFC